MKQLDGHRCECYLDEKAQNNKMKNTIRDMLGRPVGL